MVHACGLAFDSNNDLYVTNYFIHRLQKYDINGKHFLTFGTYGVDGDQLNDPLGITIYNDKVYVAET